MLVREYWYASLRVAVVGSAIITVIFAIALIFFFVFLLIWLLPNGDIASYRLVSRV